MFVISEARDPICSRQSATRSGTAVLFANVLCATEDAPSLQMLIVCRGEGTFRVLLPIIGPSDSMFPSILFRRCFRYPTPPVEWSRNVSERILTIIVIR